ncbi:unnamed protein product [Cylindrotheca closterium]|uniref:Uncharacterized protein n=1 Tax=Cylindrotheca closterium TaxID=2856 RepID=A0AAD2JLK8_9STRA|nr:unnamed protein product [Cylindrotheca closterium]
MRQSKRRKKVANEMEIGDGSEDDDHGVGNNELHYNDDDDDDVEDASSMHDEPSEEQRNDENTTERRNDESGHESNFLDISFFKLPCLQQAKLESPQSPFDVLAGSFIALKHTLLKHHWFQLFYRETEESKAYEARIRSAREKQQGVDITPHVAGRIVFAKCLKGENMNAMVLEAVARELLSETDKAAYDEGKPISINYSTLRNLIADDVVSRWKKEHIDEPLSEEREKVVRKTFQPISEATFVQKKRG